MKPEVKRNWARFQERHGLTVDGDPGEQTIAKVWELEAAVAGDVTQQIPTTVLRHTADGRRIDFIVIHHNGVPGRDLDDIRNWHVNGKGWSDVGYHRIYLDGERAGQMQVGRPSRRPGAHAEDFNDHSLGYCLIGDGDEDVFDAAQVERLRTDIKTDLNFYGLTPDKVIGHREVNDHVGPGDHKTLKNCPGRFFDMDNFRASLALA